MTTDKLLLSNQYIKQKKPLNKVNFRTSVKLPEDFILRESTRTKEGKFSTLIRVLRRNHWYN